MACKTTQGAGAYFGTLLASICTSWFCVHLAGDHLGKSGQSNGRLGKALLRTLRRGNITVGKALFENIATGKNYGL